jgi:hypothetical protein
MTAAHQGRSKVREPVPTPSQTGGIKSRRWIAIRRYTCVAAFGRKPLNFQATGRLKATLEQPWPRILLEK